MENLDHIIVKEAEKAIKDHVDRWGGRLFGEVAEFPVKEPDGQIHLWETEWRALIGACGGPLMLMAFRLSQKEEKHGKP